MQHKDLAEEGRAHGNSLLEHSAAASPARCMHIEEFFLQGQKPSQVVVANLVSARILLCAYARVCAYSRSARLGPPALRHCQTDSPRAHDPTTATFVPIVHVLTAEHGSRGGRTLPSTPTATGLAVWPSRGASARTAPGLRGTYSPCRGPSAGQSGRPNRPGVSRAGGPRAYRWCVSGGRQG